MQAEPQVINKDYPLPVSIKILTGILIVMLPVGLFIMFSSYSAQYLWTTTLFLGVQALIIFLVMIKLADAFSVITSATIIFIVSYFVEWWGVKTGFPFGYYSYTDVLQPVINGVPIAITFAWFVVSASSLITARYLLKNASNLTIVFVSSALILATDILLEPFAAFGNNFWQWVGNAIPVQNFLAWLFLGFVFSLILSKIIKWKDNSFHSSNNLVKIPPLIIGINILNFTIVNFVNRYFVLTITGLIVFALVILSSLKFRSA